MSPQFSLQGSIDRNLANEMHGLWLEAAAQDHVDLQDFDPTASFEDRIASALSCGLVIATIYARSSGTMDFIKHQLRECTVWAARHGIYGPPELMCIDRTSGSTTAMRSGLDRIKSILTSQASSVLLAVDAQRLDRLTNEADSFIQQYVVDQGLRAVMVSQGIDTDDEARNLHLSLMDNSTREVIAARIRSGQSELFLRGGLTIAPPYGYKYAAADGRGDGELS